MRPATGFRICSILKVALFTILLSIWAQAQTPEDHLLLQPRHLIGVVVDQDGKPVAEARIGHSGDPPHQHLTDLNGRFELDTAAPALVIRKTGFRSELVRTQDAMDVHVTLQRSSGTHGLPACSATEPLLGLGIWGSEIKFPKTHGIKASRPRVDTDYVARYYLIKVKPGSNGIRHASGPSWGGSYPWDEAVWQSARYEEIAYDDVGIIDSRGQLANGRRWRNLGKYNESASYYDVDEETARVLDAFMDHACFKPMPLPDQVH